MSNMNTHTCNPVIKWAGGKRQLLPIIWEKVPSNFGTYYEPFFGGGALYFSLCPRRAIVNDLNFQLTNLYRQLRDNHEDVMSWTRNYQKIYNLLPNEDCKRVFYDDLRNLFNECISVRNGSCISAALFLFLNKTCFNGVYRENSKGLFNGSFGKRQTINAFDPENIINVSMALSHADILTGDYYEACRTASEGDFVFFDPPYYATFDKYQKGGFPEEEHRRLARLFQELTDRGAYCMLTNSNEAFIKDLYRDYHIEVVPVRRSINRNGNRRTGEEVIITNY